MTQYLVAIHHPDNYDPSVEDEAMSRDIDVLNEETVAAGVTTSEEVYAWPAHSPVKGRSAGSPSGHCPGRPLSLFPVHQLPSTH
jgi:hypothetical protein